jgi:radical SAM protein with 4Fe4S-binding SPASM domain
MKKIERADLRIGYSCNNNCRFCVVADSRNKFPEMSTKEVKRLIKNAKNKDAKQITFTGGEPTLRKDIFELVKFAKSLEFETIMFTTNGRRFAYMDFTKKIVDAGGNKFMISLHAHNKKLNFYLTRVKESFDQTIQGIKNLKKLNQDMVASFVVMKPNYRILPEYAKFISNLGITKTLQLTFVMPFGEAGINHKEILPRYSKACEYVKKTIDIKDKLGIQDIIVMDVPACFLQGYESYINEFNIPNMEIIAPDPRHSSEDYNLKRRENKIKPNQCKKCKHYKICEGVWHEYIDLFGDKEFVPVR